MHLHESKANFESDTMCGVSGLTNIESIIMGLVSNYLNRVREDYEWLPVYRRKEVATEISELVISKLVGMAIKELEKEGRL